MTPSTTYVPDDDEPCLKIILISPQAQMCVYWIHFALWWVQEKWKELWMKCNLKHWNHILSDCPSSISQPLWSPNKVNRCFQQIKGCYRTQESRDRMKQTIQKVPFATFGRIVWIYYQPKITFFISPHCLPACLVFKSTSVPYDKNKVLCGVVLLRLQVRGWMNISGWGRSQYSSGRYPPPIFSYGAGADTWPANILSN